VTAAVILPIPELGIPRGQLVTAREAEHLLSLADGTVRVWVNRGYLTPADWTRPRLYWTDDLYDCQLASRRQRSTRDENGRFASRMRTGDPFAANGSRMPRSGSTPRS
jgi:hypothetical protein